MNRPAQPIIITAHGATSCMARFDALRKRHFPAHRNFLSAHITMFHKLPGGSLAGIDESIAAVTAAHTPIIAEVPSVRHLGAGVAFSVAAPALAAIRGSLRETFRPWLSPQDLQKWQPHITVQNGVSHTQADTLFELLSEDFVPSVITITGVDIWRYLDGPWELIRTHVFTARP